MKEYLYDMGFEEFAKNEKLSWSLSYAIISGLFTDLNKALLCDFSDDAKIYTARDILATSLALSKDLKKLSSKKRIGLVIPPSFAALVCNYAAVFAGKIPVNLNFTMGPIAAQSCIETSDIDLIVSSSKVRDKIAAANPKFPWTKNVENLEDLAAKIEKADSAAIQKLLDAGVEEVCKAFNIEKLSADSAEGTLVFTSGSEGAPKAAILTQKNIIANCEQVRISKVFDSSDILLANLPIFHSFGALFEIWYLAIASQYTISLISPLDIKNNVRAIRENGATVIIGSPTFLRAYLKHATKEDLRTLKKAIAGAEKTPEGFHELWNTTFNEDSYKEGYGLTETTPVVGVNLNESDFGYFTTGSRKGSIGKLFPGMQARILNPATLEDLGFGEQGLLSLKGPNVFGGYLNNPEATQKTMRGEWLVTGDLARIDADGFLYIDGRVSRFSKIGGEMVPHTTVENALNKELGFANADTPQLAVSSRLDESKGEALVLITATELSLHQVKDALRDAGISNLWHPKYIVRTEKIPLLPSGKLDLAAISKLAKS